MADTCRSCRAAVVWVETEATATKPGRRMPLDADPQRPGKALQVQGGTWCSPAATGPTARR